MKALKLNRPVAFIDVETTGLSPSYDRIIELTALKVHPDGTEELKSQRMNPGMQIPAEATAIHGITNEDVADKPEFRQYARSLKDFFDDCDIGGFGVKRFDLPILEAEFKRAGVEFSSEGRFILDALVIYHKLEPRDLFAAYRKYCGKELEGAHGSGVDVKAASEVLDCQLEQHPDLPREVAELDAFCNPRDPNWIDSEGKFVWCEGEAALNFGQYKGRLLRQVVDDDPEYIQWVASADFSTEVKGIAAGSMNAKFPLNEAHSTCDTPSFREPDDVHPINT